MYSGVAPNRQALARSACKMAHTYELEVTHQPKYLSSVNNRDVRDICDVFHLL